MVTHLQNSPRRGLTSGSECAFGGNRTSLSPPWRSGGSLVTFDAEFGHAATGPRWSPGAENRGIIRLPGHYPGGFSRSH